MSFDVVVFDLDGTIIDSKIGTANAFKKALNYCGKDDTIENITSLIGPPLSRTIITKYNVSEEQAKKAMDIMNDYLLSKGIFECSLFNGIKDVLEQLTKEEKRLAIATSQPYHTAIEEMNVLNITKYFKVIEGNNLNQTRGSKSDLITYALKGLNIQKGENALLIGDRDADIIGGKKNSVKTAYALYGYGSIKESKECQPDYIIKYPNEISELII